jgi:pSer/pThr/pTyr-binding forkhead associated (FHA) protein
MYWAASGARTVAFMSSPPFLLFADGDGHARIVMLQGRRVTIGRRPSCDLPLTWDAEVSRLHAEVVPMGPDWVLCDEGLSRNGTFVNGERLRGRRRLREGDVVAVGATRIEFCATSGASTTDGAPSVELPALTPAQRRVLEALCRPMRNPGVASPATNREIAAELFITVDTVKGTLSTLFELSELQSLPQNAKRTALAARALGVR